MSEGEQRGGIFPAFSQYATTSTNEKQTLGLFPAYQQNAAEPSASGHDWLHNPSFKAEDAYALQILQEEEAKVKTPHESSSSNSEEEEGKSLTVRESVDEGKSKKRHHDDDDDSRYMDRKRKKKEKKKSKHKHKHKKEHKKHKHDRPLESPDVLLDKERFRIETESVPPGSSGKIFIEDIPNLLPEHAFRVDRKPDRNNIMYGSIYKQHIARSRSKTGIFCLGLNKNQTFLWDSKSSESRKHKDNRYFSNRKTLKDEEQPAIDLSKPKLKSGADKPFCVESAETLPYLSVEVSPVEILCGDKEYNPLGVYDESTALWAQGKGLGKTEDLTPVTVQEDTLVETHEQYIQRRTAEYNKHTRENPGDIKMWLEFVNFQDETVSKDQELFKPSEHEKRKRRELFVLEKKISIIEKALKTNPASLELKMKQLELSGLIWEADKLHSDWENLVFLHPNNPQLWQKYLTFIQSRFSTYSTSKTLSAFHKALQVLNGFVIGSTKSHPLLPSTEEHMIGLFNEMCTFLKQAGQMEKAIASFQALIEFNLCCPESLMALPQKDRLDVFEAFWDSGMPRFGETGAIGWANCVKEKPVHCSPMRYKSEEDNALEDAVMEKQLGRCATWLEFEKIRQSRHMLPWRPDVEEGETEEDCEDPDRLVLFDDIVPCLFVISSQKLKFSLIVCFLDLLGVKNETLTQSSVQTCRERFSLKVESAEEIFQGEDELYGMVSTSVKLDKNFHQTFTRNMFSQASKVISGNEQTLLTLAWVEYEIRTVLGKENAKERKQATKELRKTVKGMLKESNNRNNLILWDVYASLEWQLGNIEEAVRIYDTAIAMNSQNYVNLPEDKKTGVCRLYRNYAQLTLGLCNEDGGQSENGAKICDISHERKTKALHILSCLGDDGKYEIIKPMADVPGTKLLKARKNYQVMMESTLDAYFNVESHGICPECDSFLAVWTECFALFQYLTVSMQAASVVFGQVLSKLKNKLSPCDRETEVNGVCPSPSQLQVDQEEIMRAFVRLVFYHQHTSILPMSFARSTLLLALKDYPEHPYFLRLYIQLESQSHILGNLRMYFNKAVKTCSTCIPWLMAIHAELLRQQKIEQGMNVGPSALAGAPGWVSASIPQTGITHKLRSMFERAVESTSGQNCILLWRLYLRFEVSTEDVHRSEGVFYRALQDCPWAKSIYMDGIQYFPDRLQEITDLMAEKEIRVRAPLEEVDLLIGHEASKQDDNDSDCGND
ncbi:protein NRDE2 homolog [Lingula anatina]|uniref:Protein NRDE2 homolog n=1 Tax=Lingula anatina TaxID=7574 RepID=A0A1S3IRQ6_LINAN|nr:protein NRDE2 homolog [Lingula anatina]|eukprot:XP_013400214.1 protein NRDE2 homolog [Lingula anatina]